MTAKRRVVVGAGSALLSRFLASCVEDPRALLTELSDIRPCAEATVRLVETPYRDLVRFEVLTDTRTCRPALEQSIVTASRGECRDVLARNGACYYVAPRKQVTVHRAPAARGTAVVYTVDAS